MNLQEIYQNLKETREELLQTLNGLSGDSIDQRKDPSSWSIGQVFQHLIKTEELLVVAIRRGLRSTEDSFIEMKPIEMILDRSRKVEAPDYAKPADEKLNVQEILDGLNQSRKKLNEVLDTLEDPAVLMRRHYVHPVLGELSLIQWVSFLYMHEQRHMAQINEISETFK